MKAIDLVQLTVLVTSLPLTAANQINCPTWSFPDADNGTECVCSSVETAEVLKCSKDTVLLRIGYCMTYNNDTKDTESGQCPYILHHPCSQDMNSRGKFNLATGINEQGIQQLDE